MTHERHNLRVRDQILHGITSRQRIPLLIPLARIQSWPQWQSIAEKKVIDIWMLTNGPRMLHVRNLNWSVSAAGRSTYERKRLLSLPAQGSSWSPQTEPMHRCLTPGDALPRGSLYFWESGLSTTIQGIVSLETIYGFCHYLIAKQKMKHTKTGVQNHIMTNVDLLSARKEKRNRERLSPTKLQPRVNGSGSWWWQK